MPSSNNAKVDLNCLVLKQSVIEPLEPPELPPGGQRPGMTQLFTVTAYGPFAEVGVGSATAEEAEALANVLARTMQFGRFREIVGLGADYSLMLLRFPAHRADALSAYVNGLSKSFLSEEIHTLNARKAEWTAKDAALAEEQAGVVALSVAKFGSLLSQRSGGKLAVASNCGPDLVLRVGELLPVTHFNALARLTVYNRKTREFTVAQRLLDLQRRDGLLALADKLARSKKKVTREDVVARKERMSAKRAATDGPLDMDFWEASEDFGKVQAMKWYHAGLLTDKPTRPGQHPDDPETIAPW